MEKSCGTIIFNQNKVLIVKQISGVYGFPKGHILGDESEIETAIRETREEVGIMVDIIPNFKFSISYLVRDIGVKEVVYFLAHCDNTNIRIQEDELVSAMWIDVDKVYDILTYDNLKQMWLKVLKIYKEGI